MAWMELSLDTTHEAVDWVRTLLGSCDTVSDIHVAGYQAPAGRQPPAASEEQPDWEFTIDFYVPNDARARALVEEIAELLAPLQRTGMASDLRTAAVAEKRGRSGEAQLFAHRIGERFVVLSPDAPERPEHQQDVVLRIGATRTFGSGLHPATDLSLRLLERYVQPEMRALDLGCGSGILSVAMARLGAWVIALDNDSLAVRATQELAQRNGVAQGVEVFEGSLGLGNSMGHWMGGAGSDQTPALEEEAAFDLIAANILARVHVALADDYRRALRLGSEPGGMLIASGFSADSEPDVREALGAAGFATVDREQREEWVALALRVAGEGVAQGRAEQPQGGGAGGDTRYRAGAGAR